VRTLKSLSKYRLWLRLWRTACPSNRALSLQDFHCELKSAAALHHPRTQGKLFAALPVGSGQDLEKIQIRFSEAEQLRDVYDLDQLILSFELRPHHGDRLGNAHRTVNRVFCMGGHQRCHSNCELNTPTHRPWSGRESQSGHHTKRHVLDAV
jgi:hypothetical protein